MASKPRTSADAIARARRCIGPVPCGRGAGAHGTDLPCDCEALAGDESVYCASPVAIAAAAEAYPENDAGSLADALIAAHHPGLGPDRSVCLRDVVDALRDDSRAGTMEQRSHRLALAWAHLAADFLEREFGGDHAA